MYTKEQINLIKQKRNVLKCSSKSITYCKSFKLKAIEKYFNEGYSPKMIFEEAGFDLDVIGKLKPKHCLGDWIKIFNQKGRKGLIDDNRGKHKGGRRSRKNFKDDKEKIEYLEAKIAYLDAENDFLAKLRGLKRE